MMLLAVITLRLAHKVDRLDRLFKMLRAGFWSILNLVFVWLILFVLYGLISLQVFGLTKYTLLSTNYINFRSFGISLLTLFRMSTGEGWNQLMHEYAVASPECITSPDGLGSDCGSTVWSFVLFSTFNVFSMYIFMNIFIAGILENFSYCYQTDAGHLPTRDGIRAFKRVWNVFDSAGTGYIDRRNIAKLLLHLQDPLQLRLFDDEYSLQTLLDRARVPTKRPDQLTVTRRGIDGSLQYIDVRKLFSQTMHLDVDLFRVRRDQLDLIYQEALLLLDREIQKISFTKLLVLLASHRFANPETCFEIKDYLEWQCRRKLALELLNKKKVQNMIATFILHQDSGDI